MKKNILFVSLFSCLILRGSLWAQQTRYISFFRHNWSLINPGAFPEEFAEFPNMSVLVTANTRLNMLNRVENKISNGDGRLEWVWHNDDTWAWKALFAGRYEQSGAIRDVNGHVGIAGAHSLGNYGFLSAGFSCDYTDQWINTWAVTWASNTPAPFSKNFVHFNLGVFAYFGQDGKAPLLDKDTDGRFTEKAATKADEDSYGYFGISGMQLFKTDTTKKLHVNIMAGYILSPFELSVCLRRIPQLSYLENRHSSFDVNLKYVKKFIKNIKYKKLDGTKLWLGCGVSSATTLNIEFGVRCWPETVLRPTQSANYFQLSFAYSIWRLKRNVLTYNPTNMEINFAYNFARSKDKK